MKKFKFISLVVVIYFLQTNISIHEDVLHEKVLSLKHFYSSTIKGMINVW